MEDKFIHNLTVIFESLDINEKGLSELFASIIRSKENQTIKNLSKSLNFNEKKVYRLILKLEKLGLIRRTGFPMIIWVVNDYKKKLEDLIDSYIDNTVKELNTKRNTLKELVKKFPDLSSVRYPIPSEFELIKSYQDWTLFLPPDASSIKACTGRFHINPTVARGQEIIEKLHEDLIDQFMKKLGGMTIQFLYNDKVLIQNIDYFKDHISEFEKVINFFKERWDLLKDLETRVITEIITEDFVIIDNSLIFVPLYDPTRPKVIGVKKVSKPEFIEYYRRKFNDLWKKSIHVNDFLSKIEIDQAIFNKLKYLLIL